MAIVVCAAALRWQQIGQLSLVHFDEGVLVSGAFGVLLHGLWHFPLAQPLQAPPLFPWMVAGAFEITGIALPSMGIFVSAVLGVATVAVYFAVLRRLYSHRFALIGAAVFAASDLHVAFSRMALTDVPLTYWFVVGAYCLTRLSGYHVCRERESGRVGERGTAHVSLSPSLPLSPSVSLISGAGERKPLIRTCGWGAAFGLAVGAAWNTKYNGWMLVAIAATTWCIVLIRRSVLRRFTWLSRPDEDDSFAGTAVALSIALSAMIAILCFIPWYRYVEQTFPGGYSAVTRNHLRYTGGLAEWPVRALRLGTSLAAFRHYGWLATLLGAVAISGSVMASRCFASRKEARWEVWQFFFVALIAAGGLTAATVLGTDAILFIVAAAAIVPALICGRWAEVLFAVWAGAFLVLTPFYHPYTRLLVPALPAVIALALWLVTHVLAVQDGKSATESGREGEGERGRNSKSPTLPLSLSPSHALSISRRIADRFLALGCLAALVSALTWHPFGWLPSGRLWQRWSTRNSYRALGDAVEAKVPQDGMVLCHGPPAMTLYIERQWAPLEAVPFETWLPRVSPDRDCYLAVDFWGAYGENHELVLAGLRERLHCLEPIAVVPNDLNLPTLLDHLPPADVVRHLSHHWPAKHVANGTGREVVFPADLNEPYADIIMLYRIDRECIAGQR